MLQVPETDNKCISCLVSDSPQTHFHYAPSFTDDSTQTTMLLLRFLSTKGFGEVHTGSPNMHIVRLGFDIFTSFT